MSIDSLFSCYSNNSSTTSECAENTWKPDNKPETYSHRACHLMGRKRTILFVLFCFRTTPSSAQGFNSWLCTRDHLWRCWGTMMAARDWTSVDCMQGIQIPYPFFQLPIKEYLIEWQTMISAMSKNVFLWGVSDSGSNSEWESKNISLRKWCLNYDFRKKRSKVKVCMCVCGWVVFRGQGEKAEKDVSESRIRTGQGSRHVWIT